ncbi:MULTISPECIES: F0F1 ATP synthase subunit epsilon [unclassified Rhizobium]|uniref:F0F1 ATP synthase subunit epsilon n=1 Tax=unclassified Rhizobium TaxID=2613769 RepID=UPI00160276C0|nr:MULTISPECIES: F0F1 ATP synthase subunit epsilon [unclassified Rhizobium]MBB1249700.1 F0F1 ATP synthase subunit epsilon [Rhizobium sp. G21]MCV3767491.1 F0F1 ATP synthase subunit epsilon [Rhizobium sp. TRM95796]
MADSFSFELVSPERLLMSASATEVVLPATEGEMAVMANHAPFMTTIRPGVVTVKEASGQTQKFVVFGGFADIVPSGCTLLAESALPVSEFRKDQLAKRIEVAQADLASAPDDEARTRISQLIADLDSLSSVAA